MPPYYEFDPGHYGRYHADNGDAYALYVESNGDTDTIEVLGSERLGSGLSAGWQRRTSVKRGHETGEWSPA